MLKRLSDIYLDELDKEAEARLRDLEEKQRSVSVRRARAIAFASAYRKSKEAIHEWDQGLWCLMVETVKIHPDGRLEFIFRNGQTVMERIKP